MKGALKNTEDMKPAMDEKSVDESETLLMEDEITGSAEELKAEAVGDVSREDDRLGDDI